MRKKDIAAILLLARAQNKHVLLQIGGNWCVWCYRFDLFIKRDTVLKNILHANYLVYHLNYSPENKNADILKTLGYPQRFGFPVLVVLDAAGNRLHTQDTNLLEQGSSYNGQKVKAFLQAWSPVALKDYLYKE